MKLELSYYSTANKSSFSLHFNRCYAITTTTAADDDDKFRWFWTNKFIQDIEWKCNSNLEQKKGNLNSKKKLNSKPFDSFITTI